MSNGRFDNSSMAGGCEPEEAGQLVASVDAHRHYINWSGACSKENQTYAGYLKKQGSLFKQWKERYFVLDSLKYQVVKELSLLHSSILLYLSMAQ